MSAPDASDHVLPRRPTISCTAGPWLVFDVGGDVGWFPSVRAFSAFLGVSVVPWVFWRATSTRK